MLAGKPRDPIAQGCGALLVSLDGETEAGPLAAVGTLEKTVVADQRLDHVERKFQPLGFLRVDGKVNVGLAGLARQMPQDRQDIADGAVRMEEIVLRVQSRQLDRNARRPFNGAIAFAGKPVDRRFVAGAIAFGIGIGHRRFAQHVEAVRQTAGAFGDGALQRFFYRAPINELPAHDAHCLNGRLANHRFAQAADRPAQGFAHAALVLFRLFQNLAREHKRKGRRIHEGGTGITKMLGPVDVANLVLDQRVGSPGVGHAQQRFGQTHQRDAFFRGKSVLMQERVDPAGLLAPRTFDKLSRQRAGLVVLRRHGRRLLQPLGNASLFLHAVGFS